MLLLERLNHTSGLPEGQAMVARWLVTHRNEVSSVTVKHVERETFTSPATVMLPAKSLGHDGFGFLRTKLVAEARHLMRYLHSADPTIPWGRDDSLTAAAKVASLVRETTSGCRQMRRGPTCSGRSAVPPCPSAGRSITPAPAYATTGPGT